MPAAASFTRLSSRAGFLDRIKNAWRLMGDSLRVLQAHKSLVALPLISAHFAILVCASFLVPSIFYFMGHPDSLKGNLHFNWLYFAFLFAFYFCIYAVIIFFNAALVACVSRHFQGQRCSVGEGMKIALSRLPVILGWAAISATVGLLLQLIENAARDRRMEFLTQIAASILGAAWTLITMLVLAVLVIENVGPITALKSSVALFKKTWGEQMVGNISWGVIFGLLGLPAIIVFGVGLFLAVAGGSWVPFAICSAIAVGWWVILALVQATIKVIYQTALYYYARDGVVPAGFNEEALARSFAAK